MDDLWIRPSQAMPDTDEHVVLLLRNGGMDVGWYDQRMNRWAGEDNLPVRNVKLWTPIIPDEPGRDEQWREVAVINPPLGVEVVALVGTRPMKLSREMPEPDNLEWNWFDRDMKEPPTEPTAWVHFPEPPTKKY